MTDGILPELPPEVSLDYDRIRAGIRARLPLVAITVVKAENPAGSPSQSLPQLDLYDQLGKIDRDYNPDALAEQIMSVLDVTVRSLATQLERSSTHAIGVASAAGVASASQEFASYLEEVAKQAQQGMDLSGAWAMARSLRVEAERLRVMIQTLGRDYPEIFRA